MQKSLRVQEKNPRKQEGRTWPISNTHIHAQKLPFSSEILVAAHRFTGAKLCTEEKRHTHAFPPHISFKTGSMNIKHQNHTDFNGNQTRNKHRFASIGGNGKNNPSNRFQTKKRFSFHSKHGHKIIIWKQKKMVGMKERHQIQTSFRKSGGWRKKHSPPHIVHKRPKKKGQAEQ